MNNLKKNSIPFGSHYARWKALSFLLLGALTAPGSAQVFCLPIRVTDYTQTARYNVCDTNCVILAATVTGTTPHYQWSFNGRALPRETASTLKLCGITTADAGLYSVSVTNSCSETNLAMTLIVYTNSKPPILNCPASKTVLNCTTNNGTVVEFTASAHDDHGTPLPVTFSPPSGSVFPLGQTIVTCQTEDACGNRSTCHFAVDLIRDFTPPAIRCPADVTAFTCNPGGRPVTYPMPVIWDDHDTNLTLVTKPPNGSTFAPGTTTVNCQVYDSCGRSSDCDFLVTVLVDTNPPTLTCQGDILVGTCDPKGVQVFYPGLSAGDDADTSVAIICSPTNGSFLPVGDTAVRCTGTDDCGLRDFCSFTVSVVLETNVLKPLVMQMIPSLLSTAGGTSLVVTGSFFGVSDRVLLNGSPLLQPRWINSHIIEGKTPTLSTGAITLTIERCGTQRTRITDAGYAAPTPRLTSIEPSKVFARGGRVLLRGENLRSETRFIVGWPDPSGSSNVIRHLVVTADGLSAEGDVPALPEGMLYGPRAVVAEDSRGRYVLEAGLSYIPNPVELDPQVLSLRQLEGVSLIKPHILFRKGFPEVLRANVPVVGATLEEKARSFLRTYSPLLRGLDPDQHLVVHKALSFPQEVVTFAQNYHGIPVFGGTLAVTLVSNAVVMSCGKVSPPEGLAGLDHTPVISAQTAEGLAYNKFGSAPRATLRPTRLVILDRDLLGIEGDVRLAYDVTLGTGIHREVFVDADTGQMLLSMNMEKNSFDFDLVDAEDEANAIDDNCYNMSDDVDVANEDWFNSDYSNDPDALAANLYGPMTWNFYAGHWGRDSYDGEGSQMEVFIHATVCDRVASWNGGCELISICSGWVDYEVMTHEFTHGVIDYGSDLIYAMQPGALNEHYADIMALIADWETGDTNWTVAENPTDSNNSYVRNLSWGHPFSDYDPGTPDVLGIYPDDGQVHYNSLIPSCAAYIMTIGSNYLGMPFSGIGIDKLRELKYAALINLPDSADFAVAAQWESDTAWNWAQTGAHGFTRCDARAVRTAWAMIGLGWPDMNCDGEPDGYPYMDSDGDGLYDFLDNCPHKANPEQWDGDNDGIGTACDNCPGKPNPDQADMDRDGVGDVCDPDRDGDGCLNEVDQHPDESEVPMGTQFGPCCESGKAYGPEGDDTNGDGELNCIDTDDDGDGIPDDQDSCPMGTFGEFAQWGECADVVTTCGCTAVDWRATCMGGGCQMYFLKMVEVMNPDPTRELIFDRVQVVNQTLFMALDGNTPSQVAAAMGFTAGIQASSYTPSLRRLELWSRATANTPATLVDVIGEYDPAASDWQQLAMGGFLAIKPPATAGERFRFGATWQVGGDPLEATLDSDKDGMPDGWERRYGFNPYAASSLAMDSDGDGVPNLGEFKAGTNPRSPASCFKLLAAEREGQSVRLRFNSELGRRYQAERSLGFDLRHWVSVGNAGAAPISVLGTGGPVILVDPEPQAGAGFYRIVLAE